MIGKAVPLEHYLLNKPKEKSIHSLPFFGNRAFQPYPTRCVIEDLISL